MNDLYNSISKEFDILKNDKEAIQMAKYMKNNFEFLGIHSKERNWQKIFKTYCKYYFYI